MVSCVRDFGWSDLQLLSDEGWQVNAAGPAATLATDDVLLFQRGFAGAQSCDMNYSFSELDAVWKARGVKGNAAKAFDHRTSCTCLGIELRDGTWLAPKGIRLHQLAAAVRHLDAT